MTIAVLMTAALSVCVPSQQGRPSGRPSAKLSVTQQGRSVILTHDAGDGIVGMLLNGPEGSTARFQAFGRNAEPDRNARGVLVQALVGQVRAAAEHSTDRVAVERHLDAWEKATPSVHDVIYGGGHGLDAQDGKGGALRVFFDANRRVKISHDVWERGPNSAPALSDGQKGELLVRTLAAADVTGLDSKVVGAAKTIRAALVRESLEGK